MIYSLKWDFGYYTNLLIYIYIYFLFISEMSGWWFSWLQVQTPKKIYKKDKEHRCAVWNPTLKLDYSIFLAECLFARELLAFFPLGLVSFKVVGFDNFSRPFLYAIMKALMICNHWRVIPIYALLAWLTSFTYGLLIICVWWFSRLIFSHFLVGHIRDVLCMLSRKESTLDAKQVFGLNVEHSKSFSAQLVPYMCYWAEKIMFFSNHLYHCC